MSEGPFFSLCFIAIHFFSNGSGGGGCVCMCVSVCSIFFLCVPQVPDLEHPHISTVLRLYPTHWIHSQMESRIELQRHRIYYFHLHPENPSLCCDSIFVYVATYVAEHTSSHQPQTILS